MANFRGFAQGLDAGSAVVARGLAAGEARKRTGLAREQLDMTKLDTQRSLTQDAMANLAANVAETTKAANEAREAQGLPVLSTEEFTKTFQKQIELGIVLANQNLKAGGQTGPDMWRTTLQSIMNQPTQKMLEERKARAEASGEVAGAATVAPYVGEDAARMRIGGVKEGHEAKMAEGNLAISQRNAAINAMNAQTARYNATRPEVMNFVMPDGELAAVDVKAPDAATAVQRILAAGGARVGLNVDAASPGAISMGKTTGKDMMNAEVAALNVVDLKDRLKEQLADKDVMTSFAGGVISTLSSFAGNVQQLANASGGTVLGVDMESDLLDPRKYNFDNFGDEASKSAAFRTNIMNYAYSIARGQDPGGRLSDKDVQNVMNSLAANSGDKNSIIASIDEAANGVVRAYGNHRSTFEAYSGQKLPPPPDRLKPNQKTDQTKQTAQPQSAGADAILPLVVKMAKGEPVTQQEFESLTPEQKALLKQKVNELGIRPGATK